MCMSTHTCVCAFHTLQNPFTRQKSLLNTEIAVFESGVTYQLQQLSQEPAQILQRHMLQANDGQNLQRARPEVWIPSLIQDTQQTALWGLRRLKCVPCFVLLPNQSRSDIHFHFGSPMVFFNDHLMNCL